MLKTTKYIAHLTKIGFTLARYDCLEILKSLKLGWLNSIVAISRFTLAKRKVKKLPLGQKLALAFEALGPSFIKFGQAISTRSDLVGEDVANGLANLRDKAPSFSSDIAIQTIEEQLGQPLDKIYKKFDTKPVAAASIAQVHKATTLDGQQVAVKILRPNIEQTFNKDLELFLWLATTLQKLNPTKFKRLKPVEVVTTFKDAIKIELDLRMEAAAAGELADNFKNRQGFKVPAIDWARTTQRVLTLEWVDGIKIDDAAAIKKAGIDTKELLTRCATSFFWQVFEDGYFHADVHPGNIFVDKQGNIIPVDFGIMGRIDRKSRLYMANIFAGFLLQDYTRVAKAHFDAGYVPKTQDVNLFAQACRSVGEPIMGLPLNEISIAKLLGYMFKVADDFEMETQPQLLLLQKTMMMAEGVGRILNPDVNIWKLAEPIIVQWSKKHMGVQSQAKYIALDIKEAAEKLPAFMDKIDKALDNNLKPPTPAKSNNLIYIALIVLAVLQIYILTVS